MNDGVLITIAEAESLADMFELNLIPLIREDTDIDSIEWLVNITSIYKKCREAIDNERKNETQS